MNSAPRVRQLAAEFLGSALLAAMVVGSGIAATSLSDDDGIRLLINAVATGLGLAVLIAVFASVSGAQFNPLVSLASAANGELPARNLTLYIPGQIVGCIAGAILANVMFDRAAVSWSTTDRVTPGHLLGEAVATAGLILVIFAIARTGRPALVAPAVGAYIGSAYFFTSSTSFANPAITVGRIFSDSFAGISPASAGPFVIAQLIGAAAGFVVVRALFPTGSRPTPAAE